MTAPMDIRLHALEKITSNFSFQIGSGGYGDVYKGVLCDGKLIAVKLLHDTLEGLDDKLFKNEIGNMSTVDHPNIVQFLGYCYDSQYKYIKHNGESVFGKHMRRLLCFEYLQGGSLDKRLPEIVFAPDWSTRYNIIKGICEGLNYLHGQENPIYHLDLKPGNILLDSFMVPKLADFGLSRLISESHTHVTQKRIGTDKYMPPEYRNGGNISEKNDVFSLGVVMIEIMGGCEGYFRFHERGNTQFKEEVLARWSRTINGPMMNYRPQLLLQMKTCVDIAMCCVDPTRKFRPTIATIVANLNETERQIPSKQIADVPLFSITDLKNSLAKTLKKMTTEPDSLKIPATKMEQVPHIREASSSVTEALIIEITEDRETSSYVEERLIIGRTEEKKRILSILSESSTSEMVVLPIYGFGGTGKTTLAQLVYNDTQFNGYSRVWVYVSEKLNINTIGNSIILQLSKKTSKIRDMQTLHNHLAKQLAGKKILIVLDDLWEKDPCELDKLKAMLRLGQGKKVIVVTTRDEAIAKSICSTIKNVPYKLEILTNDMCWTIIKQKIIDFENQADKRNLEQIGRDIAIKCGGVALAAQSIGYLLKSVCTCDQWESVRNSDIWNSKDASLGTHKVLASLRLSYSHMHELVQRCFSYCAFFPKGHEIVKCDLVHQWIALGLVPPSEVFDSMQLCEQYVTQLLGMSFLQYSKTQPDEYGTVFTMHDLVHDLARAVDQINQNVNVGGSSYRNVMVTDASKELSCPENMEALHLNSAVELPDGIFSAAKNLLVLDIRRCINEKLPNSIGKLKQLRYLNLSGSSLTELPNSIGDMKGLMHLDLSYCETLSKLPLSFGDLKQLVHLDLSICSFPISESRGGITELQYLNLESDWFSREQEQDLKVLAEIIAKLTKLQYLNLSYSIRFDYTKVLPDLEVFGKLTKLRYLNLKGFIGMMSEANIHSLLVVISTLYNLEHLDLSCSMLLSSIPESIGNLMKLHTLDLSDCDIWKLPAWMANMASLKIVHMTPLYVFGSYLSLLASRNPEELNIMNLENIKSLEEAQSIKLIEKRSITGLTLEWTVGRHERSVDEKDVLENLVPPNTVEKLKIVGYISPGFPTNWLMGIGQYLPNVSKITLKDLPRCNSIPPLGHLPNLATLRLRRLGSLEELNTADSCGELMFPKLGTLDIKSCPKLSLKPCLPGAVSRLYIDASDNILISLDESVSQTTGYFSSSLLTELVVIGSTVPLHQWTLLQHISAIRVLVIIDCSDLTSCSPEIIQRLSSLESLDLTDEILTELPTWLLELTSLKRLTITAPKLEKLNDSTRQITTGLVSLTLSGCVSMVSLPQWLGELTSLKELCIYKCEVIRSLPGSIRQLTKLYNIRIEGKGLYFRDIQKMFSSVSADTDEVDIQKFIAAHNSSESRINNTSSESRINNTSSESRINNTPATIVGDNKFFRRARNLTKSCLSDSTVEFRRAQQFVPAPSTDGIEEHEEEDIYEYTDYEESTEEDIEEHEEDVNSNVTSAGTIVVADPPADEHTGPVRARHAWTLKRVFLWLVSSVPCLGKLAPSMGLESS